MRHAVIWKSGATMAGLAILIGAVGGVAAYAFEYLSQVVFHVSLGTLAGYAPIAPRGEFHLFSTPVSGEIRIAALILVPTVGGLIAGWLCSRFAPEARGHGTDAAINAYHNHDGDIRARVPAVKALATAISLGTGGSGGREGPIAQIGAGFGSFVGRLLELTPRQRRILMAAGMGAGVGSIFRAPLAGAIFAAEILYRDPEIESDVVLPSFVASAVAYSVFCGLIGDFGHVFGTELVGAPLVFHELSELVPYTALALLLVPIIYFYVWFFYGTERVAARLPGPRPLITAAGAMLTGVVGVVLWKTLDDDRGLSVLSYGYGVLQSALDGEITGWHGARLLLLVGLFKIVTTSLTISTGGSGGVFGPSMVIGGGVGGAVGLAGQELGWVQQPACFVIVGMTGFFAGAARTPISTIIMVCEMTGSYELLLPGMWVCAISFVLCTPITLYAKQVKNRAWSPAHSDEFRVPLLADLSVAAVLETDREVASVPHDMSLADVVRLVSETHADYFPVVDGTGRLVGIFSAHDVRSYTYDATAHSLVVAADIMTTSLIVVTPEDDLHAAMNQFSLKNIDELPVVDSKDPGKLLGMLRRRAITRAYKERLDELSATRDAPF